MSVEDDDAWLEVRMVDDFGQVHEPNGVRGSFEINLSGVDQVASSLRRGANCS